MNRIGKSCCVSIVGVPMALGQSRQGVDLGPNAIRYAQLQARLEREGYAVSDYGDVPVRRVTDVVVKQSTDTQQSGRVNNLEAVIGACQSLYETLMAHRNDDDVTVVLGGDHSIGIGSVAAATKDRSTGVIWVDAHADFNTPQTSPSGNAHGMAIAALMGEGPEGLVNVGYPGTKLHPSQMVMIGIRNLDYPERERLTNSGILVFTMVDLDEQGAGAVARQALTRLGHLDSIHVSLDMDSLDPDIAPGVGTPVRGGLTYREAHLLMEILAASGKLKSLDIVEVNPLLDTRNQTAELAVELATSLLGQRII
ncbi:MAG TPA: arginase [Aggregatilineales bacterium]|nr:arginase [Aggregatilineales bacterium]